MSAIRKMNQELTERLGREPDIHEQVDMLIFAVVRERLMELAVIHQIDPTELSQSQYNHTMKCAKEIQQRNPEIFSFDDSDGGDYE
tara:strand:+ start:109 stop:366 length:258 start_codon:yes stop_codon:yes gene_type:complete